ncbi:MAG: hypothetical protein G01um101413_648 [Parcubacteria group bacterium Gr01-1014_13]|nr:MAG: hypothetical protein G01um101413_648 [Parcubacteria group bacterium Gr01-1014_13]
MSNKKLTPEEELRDLCDISVVDAVAYIGELSPGTEYFEPDVADTLIKFLQQTPDLTGVLLDGLTSVHRPGILSDEVVFYNRTEKELLAHLKKVERHEHVHWMFNELMKMEDEWLGKLRAALPETRIPESNFVYSIDGADFHGMSERMLRVIVQSGKVKVAQSKKALEKSSRDLQRKLDGVGTLKESDLQARLGELEEKRRKQVKDRAQKRVAETDKQIAEVKNDIANLKRYRELEALRKAWKDKDKTDDIEKSDEEWFEVKSAVDIKQQGLVKTLVTLTAERAALNKVARKKTARETLDAKIKKLKEEIAVIEEQVKNIADDIAGLEDEFKDLREPETSGVYHRRVDDHVNQLYKRFQELGEKHGIRIVTKRGVLAFGTLGIDYAYNRGRTFLPMRRVRRLAEEHHGIMTDYRENIATVLEELKASVNDIDVVLEGGTHGEFFARWQRLHITTEEIRMQHVNTFYTGNSDGVKHVLFLAGMPFEPQHKIAKYLKTEKPSRTRGGKPINSASHHSFIRNSRRSVSGTQIMRKHRHELMSVEAIMYRLFENKQVLETFKAVMSQDDSDNHLNSPEMDPMGTIGTFALVKQLMKNPLELYGQKVHVGGTLNLGDLAEANSKAWKEATKFRRQWMEQAKEISDRLVATDTTDYNAVLKTSLFFLNDLMGGANENLWLTMEAVKLFLKEKFLTILNESPARLLDILAVLQGNHFANAVRDVTITEYGQFEVYLKTLKDAHKDFPTEWRKPFPLEIQLGGEPRYFQSDAIKPEMVVHLGGYSVGRQGVIENYGVGHNGKLLVQKTYRVGLTHEPNAILNKARNQNADVIKSGHTHESFLMIDQSGYNMGRFIDQKPCTQRVSATELSYGGLPRTAGVDLCVYSQPGRYFKMTIPMEHMRKIGLAQMKVEAKEAVEKKLPKKK